MIIRYRLLLLFIVLVQVKMLAQTTFPYNGVLPKDVTSVAFTHATLFIDYKTKMEDATLVIEKGRVVAAGKGIAIPSNAVVYDVGGKFIYPSFIDLYSDYGLTPADNGERKVPGEADEKGALGWNPAIHPEVNAASFFAPKEDAGKELRGLGFGTVLTHRFDGIARGTSSLVCLGTNPNISMLIGEAAAHYSFNKGTSQNPYPSSLMGSIALLRQTYYDARWYKDGGHSEERNLSLQAFLDTQTLPQIFDAGDKWNDLRADKIGDEFNVQYIIKTGGNEYQRIAEIKASGAPLIVPLNFPEAYDVSDPFVTRLVSLEEMKHWELAPANCAMLVKEQIPIAITTNGLQEKNIFLKNVRKAIGSGLSEQDALKALTYTPAMLVKADKEIGALQKGMWANFIIASKNIFEDGAVIQENWVQGEQFVLELLNKIDITGNYKLKLPRHEYDLSVKENDGKTKAEIKHVQPSTKDVAKTDTLTYPVTITQTNSLITISFEPKDDFYKGVLRLAGDVSENKTIWSGRGQASSGEWFEWTCTQTSKADGKKEAKKDSTNASDKKIGEIIYPFTAFGITQKPLQETVLIKNATVWTCDSQGKIENGQVLISNGKIVAVGKNVDAAKYSGITIIDAKGKHVTPGVIDEHSHIALASINEGAQASSAEVQEAAVIWPEDINIYRQLSGGVTSAQLLHGSANPIGGQSAIVKLRWGANADDMLIKDAPKFIKFALGENVTQKNWQNDGTRFPQSRMGVEQIYYDHFIRAREYGEQWKKFNASSGSRKKNAGAVVAPRRDLEMDALYEILQKERFVTCHSYVQSEINMLMHVADSMNFTLNTFTHILEGYKVADKMKAHGAGASTFSDWWAYKFEVKDAIPYNAALMWEQGLTVAINSDDAEMARRLNQEAGKTVKYGGVSEEEALKFVTINPARLLHLDKQTGSLAPGKDADLVIWSDHPLSIYAKAEKTYVDGICYYDAGRDQLMREWIQKERARLIQKMLNAKQAGEPVQQPTFKENKHFHCDTMDQTSQGISFK